MTIARHFQTQGFGNGIRTPLRDFDGHQPGPHSFKSENGRSLVLQNADVDVTDDPLLETRPEIRSARRQANLRLGELLRSILELRVITDDSVQDKANWGYGPQGKALLLLLRH